MRVGARVSTLVMAGLLLGGCSGEPMVSSPEEEEVVVSTDGGQLLLLAKLVELHEARRPNAKVTLTQGPPSDTFQSGMGQRLFRGLTDDQVNLYPVTQGDWSMPAEILEPNSKDGVLYGVPIGIARQSSFFYNQALLESYGIDVTRLNVHGIDGVQALLDACEKIATDPEHPIERPFALGNQYDWSLDLLFWEAIFPAIAGHVYYTRFWLGEADPASDPELTTALAALLELSRYFNADSAAIDFPQALARIPDGESVFGHQGDWGTGVLAGSGYSPGSDFGVMPFPGTADTFVYSADVFPIVAGTPHRAATQEFLNTIATRETQVELNMLRGTLPARDDIDIQATDLSAVQKATYVHFHSATVRLPSVHAFKPDDVMADLATIEKAMLVSGDTSELREYITANYDLLRR